ncbi:hypothetical protein ACU6TU_03210 [Halomonas sp. LS-001]
MQIALNDFEINQLRQGYFGMTMVEQAGLAGMQGAMFGVNYLVRSS